MTKNIATTKRRLLQYLDSKDVKLVEFYKKTEIKRGFLDSDKLDASVSDVFLAKIIAVFEDLNLVWLISGVGEMELNTPPNNQKIDRTAKEKLIKEIFGSDNEEVNKKLDHLIKLVEDKLVKIEGKLNKIDMIYDIEKEMEDSK